MGPVKIGVFLPNLAGGGAERVMITLAGGFATYGHAVDLIVARADGPYFKSLPKHIRLVDLNASRPLTAVPSLVRYLRRERPKAMLSSLTHANLALAWAKRIARVNVRCVLREANPLSFDLPQAKRHNAWSAPWLIRYCYPWADAIVALSYGVADDLSNTTGLDRKSIEVIYNPVDLKKITQQATSELNHPWFEPDSPPVILAIGRMCPQKDFSTLVKAFSIVIRHYDAHLVILGEGEERPALEQLIRTLGLHGKVDLPGFVDTPYAYLSRAAAFVLPSRWEGLGNVLIEALACRTPVVATNCPFGPAEVLANGRFGSLVPIGAPAEMAEAIVRVLKGKTPSFNPADALEQFDRSAITKKFLNLLIPNTLT